MTLRKSRPVGPGKKETGSFMKNIYVMRLMTKPVARRLPIRRSISALAASALFITLLSPSAGMADKLRQGTTVMVSTWSDGTPADGGSPSVSSDGRYVAFDSWDRLSPEDTDDNIDVYRKDMQTGQIVMVSVDIPNFTFRNNMWPSISGDGTKVAFLGGACYFFLTRDLPACAGVRAQVRNLTTSTTVEVSTAYLTSSAQISRDGRYVAVMEDEDDYFWLEVADTSTGVQTYVAPLNTDTSQLPETAVLSATGRYVAFESGEGDIQSDTDGGWDVYRYDRDTDGNGIFDEAGKTSMELVGIDPNGDSPNARWPSISDDGQTVAFFGGDIAGLRFFAYVRDLRTSTTSIVTHNALPVPSFVGIEPSISGNGRFVAYPTIDSQVGVDDINPGSDVFVRDRQIPRTTLASILPDGTQGVGDRLFPSMSGDGRYVAFQSSLSMALSDGLRDDRHVYLRDQTTACTVVCLEPSVPVIPSIATPDSVVVDSTRSSPTPANFQTVRQTPYQVSATGTYQFAISYAWAIADANCATIDGINFHKGLYPGYLNLTIDGQPAAWAPYPGTASAADPACSTTHHYTLAWTGTGTRPSFGINDTNFGDNLGDLSVNLIPS